MSKLYIVPTPIGNLDDITLRAVRVLREVDLILAEDTRTSSVLLRHLGIEKRLHAHHKFNEHATAAVVAETIAAGRTVALISDAGTPGISDPGFLLVRTCVEQGIDATFYNWRGIFGPKDMPEEARKFWEETLEKLVQTQEWADTCEKYGWDMDYLGRQEFEAFLAGVKEEYAVLLEQVGLLEAK